MERRTCLRQGLLLAMSLALIADAVQGQASPVLSEPKLSPQLEAEYKRQQEILKLGEPNFLGYVRLDRSWLTEEEKEAVGKRLFLCAGQSIGWDPTGQQCMSRVLTAAADVEKERRRQYPLTPPWGTNELTWIQSLPAFHPAKKQAIALHQSLASMSVQIPKTPEAGQRCLDEKAAILVKQAAISAYEQINDSERKLNALEAEIAKTRAGGPPAHFKLSKEQEQQILDLVTNFSEHGPPSKTEVVLTIATQLSKRWVERNLERGRQESCKLSVSNYLKGAPLSSVPNDCR